MIPFLLDTCAMAKICSIGMRVEYQHRSPKGEPADMASGLLNEGLGISIR